jgi:hypothetical protein
MTDSEREITKDLIDRGLAPYIITKKDRILFAQQLDEERERDDEDIGVGRPAGPNEAEERGFDRTRDVDNGDYGDLPDRRNEDRDDGDYNDDEEDRY